MSEKLTEAMKFSVDTIVNDMQRQFGTPYLKCVEGCQREEHGDWGYLRTGWPKCCGYTMRLITCNEPSSQEGTNS